jgi:hypothetical protein
VKKEYFDKWAKTPHATMFERALKGELEVVEETDQGLYAKNCIQCHTTGFQAQLNNGNYGYLAHVLPAPSPNSWDSTWYAGLPYTADGRDVMIKRGIDTIWNKMPTALLPVAKIGCESCHGPALDHKNSGDKAKMAVSLEDDACNVCHDGSRRHSLGTWARTALHATVPSATEPYGHVTSSGCVPCHYGGSFVKWVKNNKSTSGIFTSSDVGTPISCPVCHDPHDTLNADLYQLRTVEVTLKNGFTPPGRNAGYLCMNCHQSRYDVATKVKPNSPPYYGFSSRYYPHHSNQGDMLFGTNSYNFEDSRLADLKTHASLEGTCATCHMQPRNTGSGNALSNHALWMDDEHYVNPGNNPQFYPVDACKSCHGEIEKYDDIKAMYDYDRDGTVEAVESEVAGLLDTLRAWLPKDATGEPIGGGIVTAADSALVAGRFDYVAGIWTYYFVKEDRSMGMHNAKYTVAILQKALGWYPENTPPVASVGRSDFDVPTVYNLSQNYPNPFNPTTNMEFALPQSGQVRIDVYDVTGTHVRTLINENMSAGNFRISWNGENTSGAKVASGMYLYRMVAGNYVMTKKMLMLK